MVCYGQSRGADFHVEIFVAYLPDVVTLRKAFWKRASDFIGGNDTLVCYEMYAHGFRCGDSVNESQNARFVSAHNFNA